MIIPIPSSFAVYYLNFFHKQIAPFTSKERFVPQSVTRMFYKLIILNCLWSEREQVYTATTAQLQNLFPAGIFSIEVMAKF